MTVPACQSRHDSPGVTGGRIYAAAGDAPVVHLLDARSQGWDETRLRAEARALTRGAGAPFSSRSYRYPYALAAWHSREVGIDLELVDRANTVLSDFICTEAERRLLDGAKDPARYVSSLWSAKEALTKALGDAVRYDPSRVTSPLVWPPERPPAPAPTVKGSVIRAAGRWRATALDAPDGLVAWLCWVP